MYYKNVVQQLIGKKPAIKSFLVSFRPTENSWRYITIHKNFFQVKFTLDIWLGNTEFSKIFQDAFLEALPKKLW